MTNLFQKFIKNGVEITMPVIPEVNTKTFYLSGTSDLTTAQAVLDYYNGDNNPIISYADKVYTISYVWNDHIDFIENKVEHTTSSGDTTISQGKITINFSSSTVSSVVISSEDIATVKKQFVVVSQLPEVAQADEDKVYILPSGSGYEEWIVSDREVDDLVTFTGVEYGGYTPNSITFSEPTTLTFVNKVGDGRIEFVAYCEDTGLDCVEQDTEWKNIVYADAGECSLPDGQGGRVDNPEGWLRSDCECFYECNRQEYVDANSYTFPAGINYTVETYMSYSNNYDEITFSKGTITTKEWIKVGETSPDMSNYLSKTNTTSYTPTGDYNPATKKYVDDNLGSYELVSTLPTVSNADPNKIYVLGPSGTGADKYEEWVIAGQVSSITFTSPDGHSYTPNTITFSEPTVLTFDNKVGDGRIAFLSTDIQARYKSIVYADAGEIGGYYSQPEGWFRSSYTNIDYQSDVEYTGASSYVIPAGIYNVELSGSYEDAYDEVSFTTGGRAKIGETSDIVVSNTVPSDAYQGQLWYDTVNDVLNVYDGTQWNNVGNDSSNVKAFYITSTGTSTTAKAQGQAVLDWYLAGKTPIIIYNYKAYNLALDDGLKLYFSSDIGYTDNNNQGDTTLTENVFEITYSSNSVSKTATTSRNIFKVIRTGKNYPTPYTPEYNGSPATKKYVDDNVKTYTAGTGLTLSGTEFSADTTVLATKSDLANLGGFTVVDTLPSVSSADEKTIYLLGPIGTGADKYEEWIVTEDSQQQKQWTKIGETSIDLSGYATTSAMNTALATKQDALTAGNNITISQLCESDMQGPAPEGFHVPSKNEFESIITIFTNLGDSSGSNICTNLKLPFNGFRYSTSNVGDQGRKGYLWFCNEYDENNGRFAQLSTSITISGGQSKSSGRAIRPFKDVAVIPDNTWTKLYGTSIEAGGVFWSSTDGLISLSSDGQTWITIADKNLGATTVWNSGDTLSEANCGGYFQRGNNYMFPFTGTISNTSATQVDATNYGPGNYYNSSTFITRSSSPYGWDSSNNGNLRGGVTQGQGCDLVISSTDTTYSAGTGIGIDVNNQISNTLPGPVVSATAPSNPSEGDTWYDTTNDIFKTYDGTNWNVTSDFPGMTILSYGHSTWQNFLDAYKRNAIVYTRASSNANPASGSQTRMAFMAYVNNAENPTEVEFQYYRSRSDHNSQANQLDQVFVYKLTKTAGRTVTTRDTAAKPTAGTGVSLTYGSGNMVIANTLPFNPGNTGTTGQVIKKTASGYEWANESGGGSSYTAGTGIDITNDEISIDDTVVATQTDLTAKADASDVNTKTFHLSSTTDLTTAQEIYDYEAGGGTAIIKGIFGTIIPGEQTFLPYGELGKTFVSTTDIKIQQPSGGYTFLCYPMLSFVVSNGAVTSINYLERSNEVGPRTIEAGINYSTPYTPEYDGSPATKKYVDDNVAYVGSSAPSSPSEGRLWYDTTNDVLKAYDGTNWNACGGGGSSYTAGTGIDITNNEISVDSTIAKVDDVNTKTFYLSSTSDLTTAQAAYDWHADGKNPIVIYNKEVYNVTNSYTNYLELYAIPTGQETGSTASRVDKHRLSFYHTNGVVSTISYSNSVVAEFLGLGSNYSEIYYPKYDGSPTTKKYVDDAIINNKPIAGNNITIEEVCTTEQDTKGPCESGFHIPLVSEWSSIINIRTSLGGTSSDGIGFSTALKLPICDLRYGGNGNMSSGTPKTIYYWASDCGGYSNNRRNVLILQNNSVSTNTIASANGCPVRPFKNAAVTPTSSWTKLYGTSIEAGGIFWDSTDGLISLSSDGQTWVTIADKNIGATTTYNYGDAFSESNCGKLFQRGNNYGFPYGGNITTSGATYDDVQAFGPGNYFYRDKFILVSNGNWTNDYYARNLWGGYSKGTRQDCHDAISSTGGLPSGGTVGQVLMMTADGPAWVTLS